jgi:hypothetical protein
MAAGQCEPEFLVKRERLVHIPDEQGRDKLLTDINAHRLTY